MTRSLTGMKPLRAQSKFLSNLKLIWVVQIGNEKYLRCPVGQITGSTLPSPRLQEGTQRDRHGTLARVAMDACRVSAVQAVRTRTLAAYGEVVWSWRRDPGVKLR